MENTPRSKGRQEVPPQKILEGVPTNLLCRARNLYEYMGIDEETWKQWTDAGLETFQPGTRAEWVFTEDVHAFFRARKPLGVRRSAIRKEKAKQRRKPEK